MHKSEQHFIAIIHCSLRECSSLDKPHLRLDVKKLINKVQNNKSRLECVLEVYVFRNDTHIRSVLWEKQTGVVTYRCRTIIDYLIKHLPQPISFIPTALELKIVWQKDEDKIFEYTRKVLRPNERLNVLRYQYGHKTVLKWKLHVFCCLRWYFMVKFWIGVCIDNLMLELSAQLLLSFLDINWSWPYIAESICFVIQPKIVSN